LSPRDIIRSGISRIPQTDKQSSRSRSIDAIPDDISSRAGFRDARFAGGIKRIPGIEIYPVYRAFQLKAPDRRTELRIRLAGRLSINLRGQRANKGQRATVHVSLLSKRRGDRAIPGFSPRHARARARARPVKKLRETRRCPDTHSTHRTFAAIFDRTTPYRRGKNAPINICECFNL